MNMKLPNERHGQSDREIQVKIIQIDSQITLWCAASKRMNDAEIEIGMEIAIDVRCCNAVASY